MGRPPPRGTIVTLHRFFVDADEMAGERFPIPAPIRHQVRDVLRLRDGGLLVLLPGDGSETLCRLDGDECIVEGRRPTIAEPRHRLTVVQALLKGDAMEVAIQQATEVGVAAFQLAVTERSVVRDLLPRRLQRLRAIAREAAEQSARGLVPEVRPPLPLVGALVPGSVFLTPLDEGPRLGDLKPAPTTIVVGPEGGFTPREATQAVDAGAILAGLGPRILRSRSVAAAAAAVILSRTGDFA